jgi:uncharacterized protein YjhX (UPF0386 family)
MQMTQRKQAARKGAGRPYSLEPKGVQRSVRMTAQDDADFLAECELLGTLEGKPWTISRYALHCMRAMVGKISIKATDS